MSLFEMYERACVAVAFPIFGRSLLDPECGREYGITTGQKLQPRGDRSGGTFA